jgi:hypothetical protein
VLYSSSRCVWSVCAMSCSSTFLFDEKLVSDLVTVKSG